MKQRLTCRVCKRRYSVLNPAVAFVCPTCQTKTKQAAEKRMRERKEKARQDAEYWWTEE